VSFFPLRLRGAGHNAGVNETKRVNVLRLRYKAAFDAYWAIAKRNAQLLKLGRQPSAEEVADEDRAAADLRAARNELIVSPERLGPNAT
jgi:hypothetical protein